jgi:multidrug efflux pump subunit AcrB
VTHAVKEKVGALEGTLLPSDVEVTVTRDYGETAAEKSNELLLHMAIAVLSVSLLIWWTLGRREALIVLLAIPATLALTLSVFYFYGFTLNRITLFALIFSIGFLVDDAIVVVENVARHCRLPENAASTAQIGESGGRSRKPDDGDARQIGDSPDSLRERSHGSLHASHSDRGIVTMLFSGGGSW